MAPTTVALIKRIALGNRLWGAERVRGELLKLGIHVSKRTVERYIRLAQALDTIRQRQTARERQRLEAAKTRRERRLLRDKLATTSPP